ncbi:MAG: hypothetical protein ABIK28_17735 [Planctomycetota bacterium]
MKKRLFSIACAWMALILPSSTAAAQENDNRFVSVSHGFSIERPDGTWLFQDSASASDGSFTLDLVPDVEDKTMKVSVHVSPVSGVADPGTLCDAVLDSIKGIEPYTVVEAFQTRIAETEARGFCVDVAYPEITIRVRQCYMVRDGMQYMLLYFAPQARFVEKSALFEGIWKTFAFTQVSNEMKIEQKILALAALCGSEIDWVETWEEAAARARKNKKTILIQARFYPGFTVSDEARSGPFMDPDIVALVQERFVAFRFLKGMEAPFVPQEAYGISPTAFGSSVLLATPDGEIVGDTCCIESASLHDFLLQHLASSPGSSITAPPPEGFDRLDIAQWYMRRGEYEDAMKILESSSSVRGHVLKASLLRRMRNGTEALEEIRKAQALSGREAMADLLLDEALIVLKMGDMKQASTLLYRVIESDPRCARYSEAVYWLGACKLRLSGDTTETEALWKKIIESDEQNRWAWKAAASLKSTAFMMGESERLNWPPEEVIASNRVPIPEKLDRANADQAENDAVAFLLRHQRADGSWICPAETMISNDEEPDQFTQAITAICGQSLIAYSHRPEVLSSIRRAIDYLQETRAEEKKREMPVYFMDYLFWKRSYALWFFSDCVQAGLVEVEKLETDMREMVMELQESQMIGGGWSYLVSSDLGAPSDKPQLSMSFVTAVLVMSLMNANSTNVHVPEEVIENALACLERMKNPDGTFEYMINHALGHAPRNTAPEGAAGRGPLCTLALYFGGRAEMAGIRRALDLFMKHQQYYAKEHGKTLMHAGPHAQGSHYLMFDYAYAAEAVQQLPEGEREIYRSWLLDQILSMRTAEGSYVDNPLLGWHYGTAMALKAFQHLSLSR